MRKTQLNYGKLFAKIIKEVKRQWKRDRTRRRRKKKEVEKALEEQKQKQLLSWPLHKLAVRLKWHSVYGQVVHTYVSTRPRPHWRPPLHRPLASFSQWVGHKKQRQVFNFVARSWQTEKYKQKAARQAIRERERGPTEGKGREWVRGFGPADDSERQHINKWKIYCQPNAVESKKRAGWLAVHGHTWLPQLPPTSYMSMWVCVCVCTSII